MRKFQYLYSFLVSVSCRFIMLSADNLSFSGLNHKSFTELLILVIKKPARARERVSLECLSVFVEGMKGQIKLNKVINPPIISADLRPIIHLFTLLLLNLKFSKYFLNFSFAFFNIL